MRIYLAAIALTGTLLAGCSSDWDPARTSTADLAAEQEQLSSLPKAALDARKGPIGFASLPDRGELLSYDRDREVRRSGAYTSHPVEISEEHALNAIAAGGLRLSTPDGKPVNVAFDRIEEHPDGNWSWVGQSGNGDYAVLTFGENAVFGEFSSSGKSYRVTTRRGAAFIVETDPALLAGHSGHHGDGPEFLIPPATGDSAHGAAGAKAMAASESIAAPKAASAVVDLAIGYTNGMVATYGNEATVISRLTSLVALGNQAYQRSGVNMRLRLVRAVQVNFPDNTENADALRKLTGYDETTRQRFPADPAFNALRAARDEYGADLVALVRQHRSPEQKGCGIAWLVGANQRQITAADEEFGYSVVSDGSDLDEPENRTYYCSEYSLVHELGHSMGQAHNQENAQYSGTHPYSYGYRENSASGFHTIMAYPVADSSQTEAPYFATPAINFAAGRPYGTATSDNVRSMNQTMPVISTFRNTVVPVTAAAKNDVNADGRSDIIWHRAGELAYATMNGASIQSTGFFPLSSAYVVAAIGDYNGDGFADVLWTSEARDMYMWFGNASGYGGPQYVGTYGAGWQIVATGADFNGDGRSDILWSRPGQIAYSLMNGATTITSRFFSLSSSYTVAAVGDYDGDGIADVLWTSPARDMYMWFGNASGFGGPQFVGNYGDGWTIVSTAADMNGDGRADIVWFRPGQLAYSLMNGSAISGSRFFSLSSAYTVAAIGDYNGDGFSDILWTSPARDMYLWPGNASGFTGPVNVGSYSPIWSIVR